MLPSIHTLAREMAARGRMRNMHFEIWHHGNAKKLPSQVKAYMERKFDLLPEYLDELRYFEQQGMLMEKPVTYLYIFSPWLVKEKGIKPNDYADLKHHPEMMLYEGHIAENGEVYVADRRQPLIMKGGNGEKTQTAVKRPRLVHPN